MYTKYNSNQFVVAFPSLQARLLPCKAEKRNATKCFERKILKLLMSAINGRNKTGVTQRDRE